MFPRNLPHLGPQDIEKGAGESPPGDSIERLLCALLGLVLNRKKDVEYVRHPSPDPVRRLRRRALSTATAIRYGELINYVAYTDGITILVPLKKRSRRMRRSGRRHGRARIPFTGVAALQPCPQNSAYVFVA